MTAAASVFVEPVPVAEDDGSRTAGAAAEITMAEREHAATIRSPAARARWIQTRAALRAHLAVTTGHPALALPLATTATGRLELADDPSLRFSVSHTSGLAVVASTRGHRLGVDVEQLGDRPLPPLTAWLTPYERAALAARGPAAGAASSLFRLWTAKEAVVKATGHGLTTPLVDIEIALGMAGDLHLRRGPGDAAGWTLLPVPVGALFVATVAIRARAVSVTHRGPTPDLRVAPTGRPAGPLGDLRPWGCGHPGGRWSCWPGGP